MPITNQGSEQSSKARKAGGEEEWDDTHAQPGACLDEWGGAIARGGKHNEQPVQGVEDANKRRVQEVMPTNCKRHGAIQQTSE
jgi:hypothetical protein